MRACRIRINCWHEVGRRNAPKETVRTRRVGAEVQRELRAALAAVRADPPRTGADGVVFELARGYSARGRALARLAVGVGVVGAMLAAMVAFVAPDSAVAVLVLVALPAAMVAAVTASLSFVHDTGLTVLADGTLVVEGWGGVRRLDLRSFARVTVADEPPDDVLWVEG